MKNQLLLFFLGMLFSNSILSQTPYWVDEFDDADSGWDLELYWKIDDFNGVLDFRNGGSINNFDLSATSPIITLPQEVQLLSIKQFLEPWDFSYPYDEKAEISILVDGTEIPLWEHELTQGSWGSFIGSEISFPIHDYAGQDLQVKFRTHGEDTYVWDVWRIFNVTITASYENDIAAINMEGPSHLDINEDGVWDIDIINYGTESQSGFHLELYEYKTGALIDHQYITDDLPSGTTKSYNVTWAPLEHQNTLVYAQVELTGDQYTSNDVSDFHFLRVNPNMDFNILVWDNDNGVETLVDPELHDYIQPDIGLKRALDAAGFSYDTTSYLPPPLFLNNYDIIFCTNGPWCWN